MLDLPRPLALFPTGWQQRLLILIYHRVMKTRDWMLPGEPKVVEFAWQMRLLKRHFTVMPLCEAVHKLEMGSLPGRMGCVNFDNGYVDNATQAFPVPEGYNIPATAFVSTAYINGDVCGMTR